MCNKAAQCPGCGNVYGLHENENDGSIEILRLLEWDTRKLPVTTNGSVSIPAIREGQLSGIQIFERNINFRCSKADVRHGRLSRQTGQSELFRKGLVIGRSGHGP